MRLTDYSLVPSIATECLVYITVCSSIIVFDMSSLLAFVVSYFYYIYENVCHCAFDERKLVSRSVFVARHGYRWRHLSIHPLQAGTIWKQTVVGSCTFHCWIFHGLLVFWDQLSCSMSHKQPLLGFQMRLG